MICLPFSKEHPSLNTHLPQTAAGKIQQINKLFAISRSLMNRKVVAPRNGKINMLPDRTPGSDAALASMGLHRLRTVIRFMGIVKNARVIKYCRVVVVIESLKSDLLLRSAVLLGRGDEALVILVADEAWVIARRESDAFTSASARCHTLVVVGITVCSATPRGLGG
jgi:hypothetical protein